MTSYASVLGFKFHTVVRIIYHCHDTCYIYMYCTTSDDSGIASETIINAHQLTVNSTCKPQPTVTAGGGEGEWFDGVLHIRVIWS